MSVKTIDGPVWCDWRTAKAEGKPHGFLWKGPHRAHLQNEVQYVDDQNVSVCAGNKAGWVQISAHPDYIETVVYDADNREVSRVRSADGSGTLTMVTGRK